ncbi:Pirin-related protein [Candidatus Burkholderia verschuerenii]|uniref:Pirin-related protein n=1 Tax=Candidatus Burkholderia verschuerenii TaxID=242163 RepID=A0A0L0MEB3_9BURK|nr:Pirin-related protein [Candidatus Burkholderia verschuerenii]
MIRHRPFNTLGRIDRAWLQARLHFRFGSIGPPEHAPLGPLYIWNDDTFAPHSGFGMHAHENVEIVTIVRSGVIAHEDSVGNQARIAAGDIQVMSAGKGVLHAERNEEDHAAQLFQIWLTPRSRNVEPRWAMRLITMTERFVVLASGDVTDVEHGALEIDADARVMGAMLHAGQTEVHPIAEEAMAYLVTTTGRIRVNDVDLAPRDGAAIIGERALGVTAIDETSVWLIELPRRPCAET